MLITKEKFKEYHRCQRLGLFNMLDYDSWSAFTSLSKEDWYKIISNYNKYKEAYEH